MHSTYLDWQVKDFPSWEAWPSQFRQWCTLRKCSILSEESGADRWQWRFTWQNIEFTCHVECLTEQAWIEFSGSDGSENLRKLHDFLATFR